MAATLQFPFPIPTITPEDLAAFDEAHFSPIAHTHLAVNFLPPPDPSTTATALAEDEEEEDALGYYPDGTKRTLTDTQISIFRHSEIQELLRRKRHNRNRRRKFRERQAARGAAEADEARAQAAAEAAAANPAPQVEGQVRKGRLEAALWASEMQWDEQEGGNQGKDQPLVPVRGEERKVLGRVDRALGREFLWPAIERS